LLFSIYFIPVTVLFTVWGIVTAFSHSDKELKRHAWKAWREFKSLLRKK